MIKLERNAQGNIRANSFTNLKLIFSQDDYLKTLKISNHVRKTNDGFLTGYYFILENEDICVITRKTLIWIKAYIDKKYHYVPSTKILNDFFELVAEDL